MRTLSFRLPIFVFLVLFQLVLCAQRPRIGLALSGGGAKGMAHVGVLRALEEAGVEIDYISGTSMGAVVGAMYSLGYTVDEIESYLKKVDWNALLNNDISREHLLQNDRDDFEKYLISIRMTKEGLKLPRAFNYGHNMLKELSYLTQGAHAVMDFTQFPIPFLCIATDLETGEELILDGGSLPDALRASVSFPSIFSPYEFNGRLCVDGGIRNNLPISILKQRGMDIVIAVDVQSPLFKRENLNTLIDIMEQVGSFQNASYDRVQKEDVDILIAPDITGFSITDYQKTDLLIARGYNTAKAVLQEQEVIELDGEFDPSNPEYRLAPPRNEVFISSTVVEGNARFSDDFLLGRMGLRSGQSYSIEEIERDLDRLYGTREFEYLSYRLLPAPDGFRFKLKVKEVDQIGELRFGAHYDDDFKMALLGNVTFRNVLFNGSKFWLDLAVGENPRVSSGYMIENRYWPSFGVRFRGNWYDGRIYRNLQPIDEFRISDVALEVFVQSTWFDVFTVGGGIQAENFSINKTLELSNIQPQEFRYLNYFGFINFDSFNKTFKPDDGFLVKSSARIMSETQQYNSFGPPSSVIDLQYSQVFPFTEKWKLRTSVSGAVTIGPDLSYPYQVFFGGLGQNYRNYAIPFAGYRFLELFGRTGAMARGEVYYEFVEKNYLTVLYNLGKLETSVESLFSSDILLDGWGVSYGYESPIGPLELTVMGSTNHSNIYTYISLGFWF